MLAKKGTVLGIICVVSMIIAGTAHGIPDWGINCAGCHAPTSGRIAVTGHDTTLDVGTQLDGQKHGALKMFVASPGDTVGLSVNVSDGGGKYALQLIGLDKGGQQNSTSNKLSYAADSKWTKYTSGGLYYTLSGTSNGVRTFNLTINAGTPADVYDLIFGIGLKSGGQWFQEEHFYVQVVDNTPPPPPADPVISGTVKTADGTAVFGVQLTGGGSATTDAAGAYSITVPYNFSGTITPAHADHTFEPASASYNGFTADAANENYIAVGVVVTPTAVTISGTVATGDGTPVEGVAVGADGVAASATTDAAGSYTLTVSEGFSGTVTPVKASYTFEPASRIYTNVTGDLPGEGYTATVSTVYSIADHVFLAEIHQAWDYNDPANPDDLAYVFYLAIETDATVSLVEVLTPAGNILQIPADAHTQAGNVQTWHNVDGPTNIWAYEASVADVADLAYYGDGDYTVTVHHTDTSQGQTTVLFGVAGSIEPIAQPTQEPVLTVPAHNGQIASPVTFEWEPYTEAIASAIRLELIAADGAITTTDFAADATGSAPMSLAAGSWGAELSFENGNEYSNADGITCVVVKYSESDAGFTVETAGSGGSGAGQEVIVDNSDPGVSSTGTWRTSGGKNPHDTDSLWSRGADATFTFNANLTPDRYAVFMCWTLWPSRMTDVPVEIRDAGALLDTVSVNQKRTGGQWNLLGIYTLSESASATIISQGPGSTNADAVRFVPISALDEVVIDNGAPGTSSTGSWRKSGGKKPYGRNSLWSRDAGATYTWSSPLTGIFDVYIRWTLWPSRMTDVPVEVYDGQALLETVNADQQTAGSQWNYVGTYTFNEGAAITVISQGPGSTNADAVRFVAGQGDNVDVVTVIKAEYKVGSQDLIIRATSTDQPTAILTVEGYGEMNWDSEKGRYELRIKPASDPGDSITVTSSSGGSAEVTVKHVDI